MLLTIRLTMWKIYHFNYIQCFPSFLEYIDGKGDNDWICPNCGNNNFSFRTVCNMRKCNTPKTGSQAGSASKSFNMPDGSWKCEQCNNINYAFRTKCNRQNCGAEKPSDSEKPPAEEAAEENAQVCFVMYLISLTLQKLLFLFSCTLCERKMKKALGRHIRMLIMHIRSTLNLLCFSFVFNLW
ncbi:putative Zinc finger, RanBP2-type [Helianthus annuus]|nr:putative Zinc finger, RanBP2-type [Helianthus annuus]